MVELGWYTEARAMRDLNLDGWQDQYSSVIIKLRNKSLFVRVLSQLFLTLKALMNSSEQKTTSNTKGGYYHGRL